MKSTIKMLAGLVLVATGSIAPAQTQTWDGGAGTLNWADQLNWSGDVLPGSADTAIITANSNAVINSSYPWSGKPMFGGGG